METKQDSDNSLSSSTNGNSWVHIEKDTVESETESMEQETEKDIGKADVKLYVDNIIERSVESLNQVQSNLPTADQESKSVSDEIIAPVSVSGTGVSESTLPPKYMDEVAGSEPIISSAVSHANTGGTTSSIPQDYRKELEAEDAVNNNSDSVDIITPSIATNTGGNSGSIPSDYRKELEAPDDEKTLGAEVTQDEVIKPTSESILGSDVSNDDVIKPVSTPVSGGNTGSIPKHYKEELEISGPTAGSDVNKDDAIKPVSAPVTGGNTGSIPKHYKDELEKDVKEEIITEDIIIPETVTRTGENVASIPSSYKLELEKEATEFKETPKTTSTETASPASLKEDIITPETAVKTGDNASTIPKSYSEELNKEPEPQISETKPAEVKKKKTVSIADQIISDNAAGMLGRAGKGNAHQVDDSSDSSVMMWVIGIVVVVAGIALYFYRKQ